MPLPFDLANSSKYQQQVILQNRWKDYVQVFYSGSFCKDGRLEIIKCA